MSPWKPACHEVIGRHAGRRERRLVAHALGPVAAGPVATGWERRAEVGHRARNRQELAELRARPWRGGDEARRVGMARGGEELARARRLDDVARVHDDD